MYDFQIKQLAMAIYRSIDFQDFGLKEIENGISLYFKDKIAIIWTTEDVLECADDMDIELSEDEAVEILTDIFDHHDAEYGITWMTLRCGIEDFIENRERNAKKNG